MKTKSCSMWIISLCCLASTVWAADPLNGNGTLVTKTIAVTDYNEIRINGPMDFYFEQSESAPGLEITVDENLFPHIKAEVKNRILTIEFQKVKVDSVTEFKVKANTKWLKEARIAGNAGFSTQTPLEGDEVTIQAKANCLVQLLKPVRVGTLTLKTTQSANIVAEQIEVENIKCDMDGSGSIRLKDGMANKGTYSISGGNDLHAYDFEVTELTCKMTGSGLAEVHATKSLKISMLGSGTVKYKGDATIHSNMLLGKGTVEKAK